MGYQVGNQCFFSQSEATNFKLSKVVPVISPNGSLLSLSYDSDGDWLSPSGQTISLSFPDCTPAANFYAGLTVGFSVLAVLAVAFGVRVFKNLLLRVRL